MCEDLGGVTELQGEHHVNNVITGITLALTSKPWEEECMVLSNGSPPWQTLIKVDKDHQAAGRLL